MDERTRDEILKVLRSAGRALRTAEKALLQSPSDEPETVRPRKQKQKRPTHENALRSFLFSSAERAKAFEEEDPQSFKAHVEPMLGDLLRFALQKRMYQEGPRGSGATQLDPTKATQVYERCLRACTDNGINQTEVMTPFVGNLSLKNWGDVDVSTDLVLMRYETPAPVACHLDEEALAACVEAARTVPGAVDRVQAELREAGIAWDVSNDSGQLVPVLHISGVKGQWAACVPTMDVVEDIIRRLAVIEVDYDCPQHGWWDQAKVSHDLPQQMLPIIRGKEASVVCLRKDIDNIQDWASNIPGWFDGTDVHPTPLVFRDATTDDILL